MYFLSFPGKQDTGAPGVRFCNGSVSSVVVVGVVLCFIFVCFCFSLSLLTLDLNLRGSAIHGISSKFVEINLARESYVDR